MRIDLCGLAALVPQQLLNEPEIGTILKQMRGVAVPQPVQRSVSLHPGFLQGCLQYLLQAGGGILRAGFLPLK